MEFRLNSLNYYAKMVTIHTWIMTIAPMYEKALLY